MFDLLTRYLYENKELELPGIGRFTLTPMQASTDFGARTIQAPGWHVQFIHNEDKEQDMNTGNLYNWLSFVQNINQEEAGRQFTVFTQSLSEQLNNGETIDWSGLGVFTKNEHGLLFAPYEKAISPFTDVDAKKVIRENASHHTLVGDKETTTGEMREQLHTGYPAFPDEPRKKNVWMWVLLAGAVAAAAVYFFSNGCHLTNTGNQQKVEALKPAATYKLR